MIKITTNSIRFKTSVLFTILLCVILVLHGTVLFVAVKRILYRNLDKDLLIKANQVVGILNAYAEVNERQNQPLTLMHSLLFDKTHGVLDREIIDNLWNENVKTLNLKNDFFKIFNYQSEPILVASTLTKARSDILAQEMPVSLSSKYYKDVVASGEAWRIVNYPFLLDQKVPLLIQLATPLAPVTRVLHELLFFVVLSVFLILVLTSFMGSVLTGRILKPVLTVIRTADTISHKDLSVRIREQEVDEEMRALINSFNTMIGRMETSFAHINEFSSHVAHELKTPLAIIKGEIELALDENHSAEEYKDVLLTSLQEIDRMIKVIKELLLLAKFDYKPEMFSFHTDDLSAFLRDICEHSRILALEKNIQLELNMPQKEIRMDFDPVHLRRLFFNLIHNAVKFTPPNGKIAVTLREETGKAVVDIADSGKGIAPEELARVFEKFYRIYDPSGGVERGNGLGLPIAQAIAKAHGGEITVKSRLNRGTTFTVSFPLV